MLILQNIWWALVLIGIASLVFGVVFLRRWQLQNAACIPHD